MDAFSNLDILVFFKKLHFAPESTSYGIDYTATYTAPQAKIILTVEDGVKLEACVGYILVVAKDHAQGRLPLIL